MIIIIPQLSSWCSMVMVIVDNDCCNDGVAVIVVDDNDNSDA